MAPPDPKADPQAARRPAGRPRSLAEIPKRWDSLAYRKNDREQQPPGPARVLMAFIIMLCLLMLGGMVVLWQTGTLAPAAATAAPAKPAPAHQAITAALESARALMTASEWTKAQTILREATARFPDDQDLRVALAETLIALRKPGEAYAQYEKALEIGPREARLEFAAGQVASSAGMTDRAEAHFAMAQTLDPKAPAYPLMLGLVQRKQGSHESAKASLLRAANLDPDSPFAWGTLADIALSENNVNLALQHIARARKLQPESKEWRLVEARALKRKGEPEKALMVLLPMDRSQRIEPAVVRLIAECYGMLNRHANAAEVYAEASLATPQSAELAYDTAVAYERSGDMAKALEFGRRAKLLGSEPAAAMMKRLGQ